jgi:polyisoprenoid-binding protein YceI
MKYIFVALIALFSASSFATTRKFNFSSGTGQVSFQAIGRPAAIKINGEGETPKGDLSLTDGKLNGALTFNLKSLKTGIELRDTHMKEKYLEVDKYPEAKLTLANLEVPAQFSAGPEGHLKGLAFKGKLKLKNAERDIEGTCDVDRQKQTVSLTAQFTIKLTDFAIEIPKYLGITVAEDVAVKVASSPLLQDLN